MTTSSITAFYFSLTAQALTKLDNSNLLPNSHHIYTNKNHLSGEFKKIVLAENLPEEIAKDVEKTVVQINSNRNGSPGGSGVIIEQDGNKYTVLTANHVVCDALDREGPISCSSDITYSVHTYTGQDYPVKNIRSLQKFKNDPDLAIVTFEAGEDYPTGSLGNSDQMDIGTEVFVAGFPAVFGNIGVARSYAFTTGKVVSRNNKAMKGYSLIHDANTVIGNSGGPVFDSNGSIVGIHGLSDTSGGKSNAAIPINIFLEIRNNVDNSSPNDKNVARIKKWGFIPTTCDPGRQLVSIMIDDKEYCVNPQPPLNNSNYRYNRANGKLEVLPSTVTDFKPNIIPTP